MDKQLTKLVETIDQQLAKFITKPEVSLYDNINPTDDIECRANLLKKLLEPQFRLSIVEKTVSKTFQNKNIHYGKIVYRTVDSTLLHLFLCSRFIIFL
jgi:hypothetical protein